MIVIYLIFPFIFLSFSFYYFQVQQKFLLENNIVSFLDNIIYQVNDSFMLDTIKYVIINYYDKEGSIELNKFVDIIDELIMIRNNITHLEV